MKIWGRVVTAWIVLSLLLAIPSIPYITEILVGSLIVGFLTLVASIYLFFNHVNVRTRNARSETHHRPG